MNSTKAKIKAILEVVSVFLLILLILGVIKQTSVSGEWLYWKWGDLSHSLFILIPLLLLVMTGRNFTSYGITFKNMRYHLMVVAICFIPFMLSGVPLGYGLDSRSWEGAIIMALIQIILLFVIAWLLRKKPNMGNLGASSAFLLFMPFVPLILSPGGASIGKAISSFVYYFFFVGFGEEILYRGYIQSRLNEAWGRPHHFFGVSLGWGIVITSLIFGISHLGILNLFQGNFNLAWPWFFWTFFGGLVFGFIREKTGSIVAPAMLHGLPQAIATAFMAF